MPTLIDLRRRIRSVRNSQKITQAMKTVSTAKFRKAQRAVLEARPYWHLFPDLVGRIAVWTGREAHPLFARREERRIEVVLIASDKGLAGAFNSNLFLRVQAFLEEKQAAGAAPRLVVLGKKAVQAFRRQPWPVDWSRAEHTDKLDAEDIRELAEFLMRLFVFQRTDAVYVAYNEFRSIVAPQLAVCRLLPIEAPEADAAGGGVAPDWEPEGPVLLRALLPRYVESQLHHALAESLAAEQAARMMAMDNATKNAEELITDLTLFLNKVRQAGITKELLEIMTAVEALKQEA
jgi:F-type H+-transporting ATPase subunit gamma